MERGWERVEQTIIFPCEQNIKAQLSCMAGKTKRAVMHFSESLQLPQGHLGSHFGYKLGRLQMAWSYLPFLSSSSNQVQLEPIKGPLSTYFELCKATSLH